jgi:hypothetical protein
VNWNVEFEEACANDTRELHCPCAETSVEVEEEEEEELSDWQLID